MGLELDLGVQELAARQHLLFNRAQALGLGATERMIDRRLESGRWRRLVPTVYGVPGYRLDLPGRLWAATLHLPDAAVSHESAAEVHGVAFVPRGIAAVTVELGRHHTTPFAVVHRSNWLPAHHVTELDGLRVTDRIRTLLDLTQVLRPARLEQVISHDLACRNVDPDALVAAFEVWRCRGRRRCAWMRKLLDAHLGDPPAASELEWEFLELIRRAGLLRPDGQVAFDWLPPAPGTVDFVYLLAKVIIEVDGRRWHTRDQDFERDRKRDVEAALRGWTVLRFTWRQVKYEPEYVVDSIRRALAA